MLVRETTDHSSPVTVERYSAGFRVPLLTSATGLAYLAHCPPGQRDMLIDVLARSPRPDDKLARTPAELYPLLDRIRAQGYATGQRNGMASEDVTISVPVALPDRVLAGLTMRFAAAALPLPTALTRFLPKLHACADKIRKVYSEQQAAARPRDLPATVN
jgi:IclR family mhp operon transcriptional activator